MLRGDGKGKVCATGVLRAGCVEVDGEELQPWGEDEGALKCGFAKDLRGAAFRMCSGSRARAFTFTMTRKGAMTPLAMWLRNVSTSRAGTGKPHE